jgi:hypothetical protein
LGYQIFLSYLPDGLPGLVVKIIKLEDCLALMVFEHAHGLWAGICCDKRPQFSQSHPKDCPIQPPLTTHKGVADILIFITYLLLYPVDITHYINFNYYTVYFYATQRKKRHLAPCTTPCWLWRHKQTSIVRSLFTKLKLRDFIVRTKAGIGW